MYKWSLYLVMGCALPKPANQQTYLESPFNFSLRWYILCLWKFLLFLTPVLWFPFFVLFFILFSRQWSQGDIEPYEGLYIKEGLFVLIAFLRGYVSKINPTAIDVPSLYRLSLQSKLFVLWFWLSVHFLFYFENIQRELNFFDSVK